MVGDLASMIVVAIGATALAAAVVWRQLSQRGRVTRLAAQLGSPDAATRIAGGRLAVSYGLGPAARALLPHVEREADASVRAAIALAVAHRQWEPGGGGRVLALRMWAASELETQGYDVNPFGPAFTRISDMGGPQRPAPPAAVPEPTAASAPSAPIDEEVSTA